MWPETGGFSVLPDAEQEEGRDQYDVVQLSY